MDEPLLPYDGTSGWSGSDSSRDRAHRDDNNGVTSERQRLTLQTIAAAEFMGVTWKELADMHGWHHGQASGTLSVLHKENKIARLVETRNRCAVYVLPQYTFWRDTAGHGRKAKTHVCSNCGHTEEI